MHAGEKWEIISQARWNALVYHPQHKIERCWTLLKKKKKKKNNKTIVLGD